MNRRSRYLRLLILMLLCVMISGILSRNVRAEEKSRYEMLLIDEADLLTAVQEKALLEVMEPVRTYGHTAFVTINENPDTADAYCIDFLRRHWGTESCTVFLIDMKNRKLWIRSDGFISKVITDAYSDTITDNVYTYASEGDYYTCARKVYQQMYTLLSGHKIAQPMKYITNALFALILSALLVFVYIRFAFAHKAPSDDEILEHIDYRCRVENLKNEQTSQSKIYNPPASSGRSSGDSGGSSEGSSGGSSGSGGGHGF